MVLVALMFWVLFGSQERNEIWIYHQPHNVMTSWKITEIICCSTWPFVLNESLAHSLLTSLL